MKKLKFHFQQLVPVIFTLLDRERHGAVATVNVANGSSESWASSGAAPGATGQRGGGGCAGCPRAQHHRALGTRLCLQACGVSQGRDEARARQDGAGWAAQAAWGWEAQPWHKDAARLVMSNGAGCAGETGLQMHQEFPGMRVTRFWFWALSPERARAQAAGRAACHDVLGTERG